MRNSWTKFNFIMMIISMVAGFVMVIVLTCMAVSSYSYRNSAVMIFFMGAFIVLAFHSLWGLFIEMSKNIINLSHTNNGETGEIHSPVSDKADTEEWECTSCGHSNSIQCSFCQNCGSPCTVNEHYRILQASSASGQDGNAGTP